MTIIQYKYFITVADCGSYSEAALQLYTTQSTISKQIMNLEKELGTKLFDRSHRKISLTEEGHIVYGHARGILRCQESMLEELRQARHSQNSQLHIATIPVFSNYHFLDIVHAFQKQYPEIEMKLHELEPLEILEHLKNGSFDLAFFRQEFLPEGFDTVPLFEDVLVAVLPLNHPLADQKSISLSQLAGDPFLLLEKSTLNYDYDIAHCRECGFEPHVVYTGRHIRNILSMVEKGIGVSLQMAKSIAYYENPHVAFVPLKEHYPSVLCLAHYHKNKQSSNCKQFITFCNELELSDSRA